MVEKEDGTLGSTAFHVRFGKLKVLKPKQKRLELIVNGHETGVYMLLGSEGEGYFQVDQEHPDFDSEIDSDFRKKVDNCRF